ncbi:peptidyl-dipeptidase A [Fontimonas thermophila]|uniref:Peptidyl-dipeptidase A n=1 Tax=Fontimonas thermophila TaxID=1076937 RepID=A0A1I2JSG0_9GAMM|nr:M2 family metallopeptidase [Fontimonas thermophila]SFF56850.1 peptidyl-dipeptidase A [Fontimonas thermophila]
MHKTMIYPVVLALGLSACAKQQPASAPAPEEPTAAEADAFIAGVNDDYRRLLPYLNAAQWAQATYITDDTQMLAARANEQWLEYLSRKVQEAKRFNAVEASPDTERALLALKLSTANPAPSDPDRRAELAKLLSKMEANYGAGKWCRPDGACLSLPEIEKIINDPAQPPAARAEAWAGWHATARPIRADYQRFVTLANEGARELGFANLGEMWRAGYDMSPAEFEAEVERLWTQVKPLYEALHCHVRAKLNARYGDAVVPKDGLIPAHLLGNMWAQQWSNIYPLVEPYPGVGSLDVTSALKQQRAAEYQRLLAEFKGKPSARDLAELEHRADAAIAVKMTKMAEDFYTSLGFPKLPDTFWERSLLLKPRDREVVCHASAWDMNMQGDVRIKQCIEPDEDQLTTIHHELGHIYYYLMYNPLPPLFQAGAHDGFHEAIGDTVTLSLTPAHLHKIGLVPAQKTDPKAVINAQMKWALDKIVFLPWGKLVDQWRWKVFAGEIPPERYNASWWALRAQYQGVSPPLARSEEDFDPGAKYHIPGNTPYTRYFLAFILQFQFQKALCDAAGFAGPLHECDIYGNREAGRRFMDMLAQGASRPWPETLEKLTGTREMDGAALIEYFSPLMDYLAEQNKGLSCGWQADAAS